MHPLLWGFLHLATLQGASLDTHRTFSNKLCGSSWGCMNPHCFDTTLLNCLNDRWFFLNRFRCAECKCCFFVSFQSRIAEISKLPLHTAQKETGCVFFSPAKANFRGVRRKSIFIQRNVLLNKFIRRGYEELKQTISVMELLQLRVACLRILRAVSSRYDRHTYSRGCHRIQHAGHQTKGQWGSAIHLCDTLIGMSEYHVLMI